MALTVWTITQACPDVAVVEVPDVDVAPWLAEHGCDEPCFILHAGMLVLRDPWANVPQSVNLADFASEVL